MDGVVGEGKRGGDMMDARARNWIFLKNGEGRMDGQLGACGMECGCVDNQTWRIRQLSILTEREGEWNGRERKRG